MLSNLLVSQIKEELALTPPIKLEGWTTPERGIEMAELVIESKPKIVVEIGVFGGRSLIAQALALRDNDRRGYGRGRIYGIDPWKVDYALEGENADNQKWWKENVDLHNIHKGCMDSIYRLELEKYSVVIRAASQDCIALFDKIDTLHIDGNHSEVASCRDVKNYVPLVKSGGFVWFDDADWPSTKSALDLISKSCDLKKDFGKYRLYQKK